MLWSLIKVILFLGFVALAAWSAGLLMESEGGVRIAVANYEFTLGALESVIGLMVLVLAVWLGLKIVGLIVAFLHFLNGDETAITRYFARNRERKGYDALAEGMMALASGDGRLALTKAAKAERLLHRPDLTTLLTAQAAEQAGDRAKAEEAYKRLLSDEKTRFVGVRGLMQQKLEAGQTDVALKLAEKAFALKPKHEGTQDILLKLQAGAHEWSAARKTLGAKLKHGGLPRDVHKRRDAVLALGEAKDILDESKPIEAREAAIAANRLSPDLIPAAVMAADGYVSDGKPKNATRVLKKAWEVQPHPDLAAAFARIKPDENPRERIARFRLLTNMHRDNPETRMLEAELQIAAEDFPEARKALGDLAETDPTARSLTIMAAIERGAGADDAVVKGWLARALTAPRGPKWVCDNCQKTHAEWGPVCDSCGGFDTLSWRRAEEEVSDLPAGTEMLPLIVGQIAKAAPEIEDAVVADAEIAEVPDGGAEEPADPDSADRKSSANADAPPADYAVDEDTYSDEDAVVKKDAT
ncbi:heme biosynthesis protein HemY [Silicimonas sp. MF1-12-2]|uniref:heme biosynthesis protein HemY n=1 Tax=Silicimonas sp. MF1-12-2 TaxID=3384793 RepID=UPI0039B5A342